jgi:photosystem II stability/assembly factor-like uncharacterized protein
MSSPTRRSATLSFILIFACLTGLPAIFGSSAAATKKKTASAETPAKAATPGEISPVGVELFRSLSWRSIGPANMGGRVSEITLVPGKPAQFFVATGTGGLFKTGNAGTTFTPIFDEQPVLSIGSVAVAPSNPDIVYVGTGEGNGRNSSTWGNGIYKSTDGGESFTHLGLADSRDIPRLAVHPKNPDIVFAAVMGHLWDANKERGLYRTTDGGKTWTPALQIDENHGCIDVALDPSNPDVVYAAVYARRRSPWSFTSGGFGDKGGIYKSTDGGKSFRRLTEGLPRKTGRMGLALFAGAPGHVYAVIEADDAGTTPIDENLSKAGGVFRSTDAGEHWTRLSQFAPRPFYFSKIVVDPKDENRVYVLGFNLSVSDDGGRTFRADGAVLPHVDWHTLVVDPSDTDRLLAGSDGGVYESRDRAKTWRYLDNVPLGEFYEIGLGMDSPYTICGGLQDNGTWCGTSRGTDLFGESDEKRMNISNRDWFSVWDGDGYYAQIDPRNPALIYAESQQGFAGRVDLTTNRIRLLRPEPKEGMPAFRFNWNSPLLLSKHDPDVLYLGGNRLFRLTRRGDAWEAISPDLSNRDVERIVTTGSGAETHGTIVALAESPLKAGLLWAGTDDGNVHVTRDDGRTWQSVTARLSAVPKGTYVSRLEASHFEPGAALASFDGHRTGDNRPYILETRDFGSTWKSLSGGLPVDGPVRVVREDLVNENLLFAGTEFGLFVTFDRGRHWVSLRGESLPPVQVHDLQIHPRDRDLVAGTHGRSVFILDDITGLEQMTAEAMTKPLVLFNPRPARGYYLLGKSAVWGNDRFGAKNPPFATINYWVKDHSAEGAKLKISDARGLTVRELTGSAEPGLNRITWDLTREKQQRIDPPEAQAAGQTPFVAAGEYDLALSVGKDKVKAKLSVAYPSGVGPESPIVPD